MGRGAPSQGRPSSSPRLPSRCRAPPRLGILALGEGNKPLFLVASLLILSFYGAGFATVPAYLKDLFGTYQVGAIHGRLLTAWSAAGVLGPLIVNAIVDASDAQGADRYTPAFVIMVVLLAAGFVANELIRPVDPKYYVNDAERAAPAGTAAGEERSQGASR